MTWTPVTSIRPSVSPYSQPKLYPFPFLFDLGCSSLPLGSSVLPRVVLFDLKLRQRVLEIEVITITGRLFKLGK